MRRRKGIARQWFDVKRRTFNVIRWKEVQPYEVENVDYYQEWTMSISRGIAREPNRRTPPMHPGEILREKFMLPNGISAHALAMSLRVPSTRISEIVNERRSITADTAYRLALHFGTSADLWMNLQTSYELACIERDDARKIKTEVQRRVA